jgi:hypothetical protein
MTSLTRKRSLVQSQYRPPVQPEIIEYLIDCHRSDSGDYRPAERQWSQASLPSRPQAGPSPAGHDPLLARLVPAPNQSRDHRRDGVRGPWRSPGRACHQGRRRGPRACWPQLSPAGSRARAQCRRTEPCRPARQGDHADEARNGMGGRRSVTRSRRVLSISTRPRVSGARSGRGSSALPWLLSRRA